MARSVKVSGAAAKESTSGGTLLPAGEYIATIIDVEEGEFTGANSKGIGKLTVQFKISEGEFEGKKIKTFGIPLQGEWNSGKVAFLFYQFFGALGVKFPEGDSEEDIELPDNEDLWEQEIGLVIKHEPDYKDETITRANISGFFPASRGVKNAPKAAVEDDLGLL